MGRGAYWVVLGGDDDSRYVYEVLILGGGDNGGGCWLVVASSGGGRAMPRRGLWSILSLSSIDKDGEANTNSLFLLSPPLPLSHPPFPQVCSPTTSTSSPTPPVPKKWTAASTTTCSTTPNAKTLASRRSKTCILLCVRSLGLAIRTRRTWPARPLWRNGLSCGER